MRRLFFLLFLLWPATSEAAVKISFYSRDFGSHYPHAFVLLTGTLDATGEPVEANYGWTSTAASVVVLAGRRVKGKVSTLDDGYIRKSHEGFSLILTDEEYRQVVERVTFWQNIPQPSYSLNEANCVFFVADVARTLGLKADPQPGLMLRPKSFLQHMRDDNRAVLATRQGASLALSPPPPPSLPPPGRAVEPAPPAPAIAAN